jgi:hypothetical protein
MGNPETQPGTLFDDINSRAQKQNMDVVHFAMGELKTDSDILDFLRGYIQGRKISAAVYVVSAMWNLLDTFPEQTAKIKWQAAIRQLALEIRS